MTSLQPKYRDVARTGPEASLFHMPSLISQLIPGLAWVAKSGFPGRFELSITRRRGGHVRHNVRRHVTDGGRQAGLERRPNRGGQGKVSLHWQLQRLSRIPNLNPAWCWAWSGCHCVDRVTPLPKRGLPRSTCLLLRAWPATNVILRFLVSM